MTTIKAYDTGITFTDALTLGGAAYDLTSCTVKFIIAPKDGSAEAFEGSATIVSAVAGTVSYQPGAGFPTVATTYHQEWEVTTGAGRVLTFPGDDYNDIKIIEDLNKA